MFRELDSACDRLGVSSYGLNQTTLEEVFLRLADEDYSHSHEGGHAEGLDSVAGSRDYSGSGGCDGGGGEQKYDVHNAATEPGSERKYDGSCDVSEGSSFIGSGGGGGGGDDGVTAEGGLGDGGMAMGQQSGMVRQVRALFKRRLQIARRDKKTLFLQCVLPLITVTVSAVFGSLQNIGDSGAGGFLMSPATFASAVVDQYAGRHPFYLFTAANTGEERRPVTYPGLYHVLSSSTIEYMNRRECVFRFGIGTVSSRMLLESLSMMCSYYGSHWRMVAY